MTLGACREQESVQKGGLSWQREYSEGRQRLKEPGLSVLVYSH
jgi:hypothetical protein